MSYSSDLKEEEWLKISLIINKRKGLQGRPPPRDAKILWNGIFYVVKNGCFWRDLPKEFGHWKRVYNYYNRLKHRGLLEEIMHYIREDLRKLEGRKINPSLGIIDSQTVKSKSFKK